MDAHETDDGTGPTATGGGSPVASVIETALGPVEHADTGGDGPVVLFVHGSPGGWDQAVLMGRFLTDAGLRVVAPSRPGYLGTPLLDGRADPADQARLHSALLDALGIDDVAVACWSGGGPSSYSLAAAEPDRVRAVAAFAAVSGPYSFEHPGQERALFHRPGAWLMRELARHAPHTVVKELVTEEGDLSKAQAAELVGSIWDDEARRSWVLEWAATVTGDRSAGFDNDVARFPELSLDLAAVRAPVLLVHAETDSDVPVEQSRNASEALPRNELVTVDGGTRITMWTGPGETGLQARVVDHLLG